MANLLVTPSELAPFAKLSPMHQLGEAAEAAGAAAHAVCINPGRLTKGASGVNAVQHGPQT